MQLCLTEIRPSETQGRCYRVVNGDLIQGELQIETVKGISGCVLYYTVTFSPFYKWVYYHKWTGRNLDNYPMTLFSKETKEQKCKPFKELFWNAV